MKYLIISNMGEIPLWGMTHVGISSARDKMEKIGQFGSGAKHGILVALRAGLDIKIYSGMTEIVPKFLPIPDAPEHEELVFFVNGVPRNTSLTKGFGDIDWKADVQLALREFFSNAIDQGETAEGCYSISKNLQPVEGMTQIILKYTGDVQKFISELSEWYVTEPVNTIFTSTKPGTCYLKGVKVGKIDSDCLFSYNFAVCELNESRQVADRYLRVLATGLLTKNMERLKQVFKSFHLKTFETQEIQSYNVPTYNHAENIIHAWQAVHGKAHPALSCDAEFFSKKKIPFVVVPANWYEVLTQDHLGLGYIKAKMDMEKRYEFGAATKQMQDQLDRAWNILEHVKLTNGMDKPPVGSFSMIMDQGTMTLGMLLNNKVFFNIDEEPALITALEELTHYVTSAKDETRDFQDFALRLAARLALKLDL